MVCENCGKQIKSCDWCETDFKSGDELYCNTWDSEHICGNCMSKFDKTHCNEIEYIKVMQKTTTGFSILSH